MNHPYNHTDPHSPSGTFEPDELPVMPRRPRRRVMAETASASPAISIPADTAPKAAPQPRAARVSEPSPRPATPRADRRATPKVPKGPGLIARMLADKRPAIFAGIVCLVAAIYIIVAFISYFASAGAADQSILHSGGLDSAIALTQSVANAGGPLGAWLAETLISRGLGLGALMLPYYLSMLGLSLVGLAHRNFWVLTSKSLLTAIALSIVIGMVTYTTTTTIYWGGRHGHDINMFLKDTTGIWGMIGVSIILVASVAMIFLRQITDTCAAMSRWVGRRRELAAERRAASAAASEMPRPDSGETPAPAPSATPDGEIEIASDTVGAAPTPAPLSFDSVSPEALDPLEALDEVPAPGPVAQALTGPSSPQPTPEGDTIVDAAPIEQAPEETRDLYDPTAELSMFRRPSLDLLDDRPEEVSEHNEQEQTDNINNIRRVLANFGIGIARIEATVGPTVTLYEIVPAEGIRINRIRSLEDDIALSLSALGIRIIAPMPGKGTIGIEVPNKKPRIVSIRSILASKKYLETKAELPMAMGATISNDVYIADLTRMPHLLVAGSTGMGKSVGLNTIIASILYKKHPAEVKFVLIDPKMVEFSLYNRIERHYLAKLPGEEEAIITNMDKVVPTLLSLCMEMENRYELLKAANVRTVREYNDKFINLKLNPSKGHRYMPYIVVVIDEFADLIMTAGKEVETPIARLAQKARAIGIHVILATQRPSANIITGVIRANFPGRIAFRVTQQLESRIILDRSGANQLIGRGDMLFSRDGIIDRVQCAFIDTHEVEAICEAIGHQAGYPMAYELPEYIPPTADGADKAAHGAATDRDPLFEAAAREILDQNVGSTSLIQRRFEIGYPRAGKIMDQLERAGVVGPAQGGKPRKVLMTHADFDQWMSCTGTLSPAPAYEGE